MSSGQLQVVLCSCLTLLLPAVLPVRVAVTDLQRLPRAVRHIK
jgi:hypothetical protein